MRILLIIGILILACLAIALAGAVPARAAVGCGDTIAVDTVMTGDLVCAGDALLIGADGITLDCDGHSITGDGTGAGIFLNGRSGVTVKNCRTDNFYNGIYLFYAADNLLSGNSGSGNTYAAILVCANSHNNTVVGNTVTRNRFGIFLYGPVDYSVVSDNLAFDNSYAGISMHGARYSRIIANTLRNNFMELYYAPENTIAGNEITGAYSGIGATASHDNLITHNVISGSMHGIVHYYGSRCTISANAISDGLWGVLINYPGSGNRLAGNVLSGLDNAVLIGASDDNTITENDISGGTRGFVFRNPGSGNMVYRNNVYAMSGYPAFAEQPVELSHNGEGNWWGRSCDPLFVPGADSNRADVVDSHPYGYKDGWLAGRPPGEFPDADADGLGDACDDCPGVSDPDQTDTDADDEGDACDCDDGFCDGREGLFCAAQGSPDPTCCVDADEDGYGRAGNASGCAHPGVDCDDADASVNPGAAEACDDRVDNDCDGSINEGCAGPPQEPGRPAEPGPRHEPGIPGGTPPKGPPGGEPPAGPPGGGPPGQRR
ncbi:MAG: right-handed parallel beta-helix repeat-containing protein [Elusimicrobiota bacterium]